MIRLTRLNQVQLVVNSDLIEHIEMTPDTVISLTNGQKFIVQETSEQVIERVIDFRRKILAGLPASDRPPSAPVYDAAMATKAAHKGKIDLSTLVGIVMALVGIVGGLLLEGGRITDIWSITAGMIVIAGTVGAVMITTPLHQLISAGKKLTSLVWDDTPSNSESITQILHFTRLARRGGLTSLESQLETLDDPFFKKALSLAVDGADLQDIRRIMELEIELAEHRGEYDAKVFETAGGYSPTIGIIGAVLGLIQVMKHLEDIERVGHGIAVAFVATVYGVAFANLFLLPVGAKLRSRLEARLKNHELVLEGVLSLAEGMNPMLIQSKLDAYEEANLGSRSDRKSSSAGEERSAA